jgi:hypothetical protein
MESRVLNDTTIEATYDPSRVTKETIECKAKVKSGSPKGICTQYMHVGCKSPSLCNT